MTGKEIREDHRAALRAALAWYNDLEGRFGPGTVGEHELLDRLHVIDEMWENHIFTHPATTLVFERYKLASEIADKIAELYQLVGTADEENADE